MEDRVNNLVAQFNGAIKYNTLLKDHSEWSDEECLAYAYKWHEVAIKQLKASLERDSHWHNPLPGEKTWNDRIPYCRNMPTNAMIKEALN